MSPTVAVITTERVIAGLVTLSTLSVSNRR